MKKLILIKLGGSLISDKTKVKKARSSEIKKLAKQIKEFEKDYSVILFTGAGGFGHPLAEKYKNNLAKGLPEIKNAVKELNLVVVNSLNNVGLKALSVEPDKAAVYKDKKLETLLLGEIVTLLNKDIIPVFHADLVHDKKQGISVLSMDKFLVDLAFFFNYKSIKVEKAIFAGTTPVLAASGAIIKKITNKDYFRLKNIFYKTKDIDVSGGMKYKVEQCLRLAEIGINSHITDNLLFPGTLVTK